MFGKFVSLIGTQMQSFALSLYVLSITNSSVKFASVLAVTLIPRIVLGPFIGVFVDWFDRKKLIVYGDLIRGIIIAAYSIYFVINGELPLVSIYILVVILAFISMVFQPAINTVIPSIIKKEDLVDANGINSFIMKFGNLIAPGIAGILYGYFGLIVILILNAVSFIISGISEIFIKIEVCSENKRAKTIKRFVDDFLGGIKFLNDNKLIFSLIILGAISNFAFNPVFSVGIPYISKSLLKVTDFKFGLQQSLITGSMMISPIICSKLSKKIALKKMVFYTFLLQGILISVMAIIPTKGCMTLIKGNMLSYLLMIIIGGTIAIITGISNIAVGTMINKEVPLNMMGRISTILTTGCMSAIPLGQMIFGKLFDSIEAWLCLIIASVILIISVLLSGNILLRVDENKEVSA